jgi:hypothetical protein
MSSQEQVQQKQRWVPGHCMYKPGVKVQNNSCPVGYVWRKGHYRREPSVESTHKYFRKFDNKLQRTFARHPVLCQGFETLPEFQNCLNLVRRSMKAFLLKNPSRSQIKKYAEHLVDRVIFCAGKRLQDTCYFQAGTKVKRYIEARMARYMPPA